MVNASTSFGRTPTSRDAIAARRPRRDTDATDQTKAPGETGAEGETKSVRFLRSVIGAVRTRWSASRMAYTFRMIGNVLADRAAIKEPNVEAAL